MRGIASTKVVVSRIVGAGLLFVVGANGAVAQTRLPLPEAQVTVAASEFIAALSCMSPQDATRGIIAAVHLGKTKFTRSSPGADVWAVVYSVAMMGMEGRREFQSCGGGNGNPPTEIAIVRSNGFTGEYYVDPTRSWPVVEFNEPIASVRRVTSYGPNSLTLIGFNYGPHDSQAGPSQPAQATMTVNTAGNWSIVESVR